MWIPKDRSIRKKNVFFGGGIKTFRINCKFVDKLTVESLKKKNRHVNICSTHPHNFYLQLLAETGIIGFMFIFV